MSPRFSSVIEASFGLLTDIVEWEFNFGSGQVHAWPKLEGEVKPDRLNTTSLHTDVVNHLRQFWKSSSA